MAFNDANRPPRDRISDISFSIYRADEIRRISVKEIDRPETFDELQHPVPGGLYDPALGSVEMFAECASCGCRDKTCPGHIGHIELCLPVYNPVFFSLTVQLLKGSCFHCNRLFTGSNSLAGRLVLAQLRCLERGLVAIVDDIQAMLSSALGLRSAEEPDDAGEIEGGSKRKSRRATGLDIIEEGFDIEAETLLQKILTDALEREEAASKDDKAPKMTRNSQSIRQSVIRQFCSRFLFNRRRKCPHCRNVSTPLAPRAKQVILIGSTRKKAVDTKEEAVDISFNASSNNATLNGTLAKPSRRGRSKTIKTEPGTAAPQSEMESVQELLSEMVAAEGEAVIPGSDGRRILSPMEARQQLRAIWEKDHELLEGVYPLFAESKRRRKAPGKNSDNKFCPTDLLFCDVIAVPPPQFRPVAVLEGSKFENRQTLGFRQVLELNTVLKQFITYSRGGDEMERKLSEQILARVKGRNFTEKLQQTYVLLQTKVNALYDATLAGSSSGKFGKQGEVEPIGLRQILEKKEGIFRMNMMGKRVNYACRTVITPDPYMDVDGIGIPDIFAWKLTFPTPVNQLNLPQMRQAVVNGPKKYPGANFVISEFGHSIMINDSNVEDRKSAAKRLLTNDKRTLLGPKKVLRHLLPGDYMLLNRQPTLHKPSIMAHKVHILREQKTLRLNYATCKTYNADFDGDEMNAHLPQDLLSQAECHEILNVIHQYLVPKDGTPLSGLIQDHIVSGVLMTLKDKFFSKEDYEFLVLSAFGFLNRKLRTLRPAIWKPVTRWTGKQVVSTVILNVIPDGYPLINLDSKAKTALKNWQITGHSEPRYDLSDSHVVFRNCELLVGVFDKAHYGPTPYSLVHCCYELYGPRVACNLLSCFSRLFTTYLQLHGFSFGPADLIVNETADKRRREILKELPDCGRAVMQEVFRVKNPSHYRRTLEESYSKMDRGDIKQLDFCMKSQTDKVNDQVNKACLPHGLLQVFPNNALLLMIECGAKGNMVNSMQMSCMLGQIELEGCRPPVTNSGRSLPSFKPYDPSPRAGGFVAQRFLTGVKPQEFFFHCMAGREGLIDTAVKTSRSGYLQRCIIKHLESLVVGYDLTVRDADQSVIQFQYGEDGLDIGKVQFLQDSQLPFLLENYEALRTSLPSQEQLNRFSSEKAEKLYKKISKWTAKHPATDDSVKRAKESAFMAFTRNFGGERITKEALVEAWNQLDEKQKKKYVKKYGKRCPDPVAAVRNPCVEFGVLPERILQKLEQMKKAGMRPEVFEEFRQAIYWKALKAVAEPGEAVGLLAAQSIGEPSTQMTLNTFHFAGRGEMNVTLGIPRLREILMTASERITTPAAQVPFRPHVTPEQARELHRRLNNIPLDQVLKSIDSQERLTRTAREEFREYTLTLTFTKRQSRPHSTSHLTCQAILRAVEKSFMRRVALAVKKVCDLAISFERSRPAGREKTARVEDANDDTVPEYQPTAVDDEAMSDEEVEKADEDASGERLRQKHNDENEYVGEDEEQKDVGQPEDEDEEEADNEEAIADDTSSVQIEEADDDDDDIVPKGPVDASTQDANRVKTVMSYSKSILNYEYDAKKSRWCRVTMRTPARFGSVEIGTIVRREAQRFSVQGIPGVQRCLLSEVKGRQALITEGVNLQAFFEQADYLDVNKIYCNHIHVMAKIYGIEAGLKSLIKETQGVFGNYGIVVDYRHLSLVADYMMHTGAYKPFNRVYMSTSTSPFQKMSFETTMKFLKDALEAGETDHMRSTSASIIAGQMPKVGTGLFDVMVKLK